MREMFVRIIITWYIYIYIFESKGDKARSDLCAVNNSIMIYTSSKYEEVRLCRAMSREIERLLK